MTSTKRNLSIQADSLAAVLDSVIYQGDSLLGTTPDFDQANDAFDLYLGARDSQAKQNAKNLL